MTDSQLRKDLLLGFEYSYCHSEWITPLDELLSGLGPEEALWQLGDAKCIWEIVLHVALWHEDIVRRIETGLNLKSEEGAWPSLPPTRFESDWAEAKARLEKALESVKRMLETVPISQIEESPYGLADLLCRFTHNGYHLGQIEKIRIAYGLSLKNEIG